MTFVAMLVAAGAMFIVPTGIGFLVTASDRVTDPVLHYATSWCIGLVGFSAAHAIAAAFNIPFISVLLLLVVLAAVGWIRVYFEGNGGSLRFKEYKALALLYIFILFAAYFYRYFIISKYPFSDIFQEVHTFGSIYLLQDTGRLDLFSTDSYVPLRQSVYVALSIIGVSPIDAYWMFPIPILGVCTLASFGLAGSVVQESYQRFGLAALLAPVVSVIYFTNGSMLSVLSMILLARLVGPLVLKANEVSWCQVVTAFAAALGAMVTGALVLRANVSLGIFVAVLVSASVVSLAPASRRILQPTIIVVLLSAGFALHRGSIVFIPCVLFAYASLCAFLAVSRAGVSNPARRIVGWVMIALGPISVILPTLAALEQFGVLQITESMLAGFSAITGTLLDYELSPGSEIMLGTGPVVALIEIARDVGPAAGFSLGAIALLGIWLLIVRPPQAQRIALPLVLASWAWTCSIVLLIIISSGLPFAYRVNGLAIVLLSVSAYLFLFALLEESPSWTRWRASLPYFAGGTVALSLALFLLFYQPDGVLLGESAPYLRLANIYLISALALGALCVALAVWLAPRPIAVALALVGASLAFTSDRAGLTTRLMTYSYGSAPENLDVISFYSADELDTFKTLNAEYDRWLVLSDPVTVSSARALGGALSFFNYSNLDTMPVDSAAALRSIMRYLLHPPAQDSLDIRVVKACQALLSVANSSPSHDIQQRISRADEIYARQLAASAAAVGSEQTSDVPSFATTIDEILERPIRAARIPGGSLLVSTVGIDPELRKRLALSEPDHWSIVFVVTARTLTWINNDTEVTNYFPPTKSLSPYVFQAPLGDTFPLVAQKGDRLFAFNLTCPFAK
ncbi:MAG: hypothetical protein MO846_05890 [Candidatus Devosia symbiotica]|nr:hypothetical protein [Candidatus Devosia symbiotica]